MGNCSQKYVQGEVCSCRKAFYAFKEAPNPVFKGAVSPTIAPPTPPQPTQCVLPDACLTAVGLSIVWLHDNQNNMCELDWSTSINDNAQSGMHKKCPGTASMSTYKDIGYKLCYDRIRQLSPATCEFWTATGSDKSAPTAATDNPFDTSGALVRASMGFASVFVAVIASIFTP